MFTFEATKTTPFAPLELEGEYKLTIKGRHMKMTKVDDGINTCLGRIQEKKKDADKIKVGDEVKVVNSKSKFSNYIDWVIKNVEDKRDVALFANNSRENINGEIGVVIAIAPHSNGKADIAYVRFGSGVLQRCYLFDMDGLKKI